MSAPAYQMNLEKSKRGIFLRAYRKFNTKGYSASKVGILAKVLTFSAPKNGEEAVCRASYKQFESEFGYSAPTVAAALTALTEGGVIEAIIRDKEGTGYRYVLSEKYGRKYDVIPLYLYTAIFPMKDGNRKLRPTELRILARMMTDVDRSGGEGKGVSTASISQYARELGVSRDSVKRAIRSLLRAKLIFRPKEDRGTHKKNVSVYHVNKELFAYKQYIKRPKATKKQYKTASEEAAEARADRERFYAARRTAAISKAESNEKAAERNPEYRDVAKKLAKMEIAQAKTEVYFPDKLPALIQEKESLLQKRRELLRLLGLEEADLKPKFHCSKCEDSGFLSDGRACDCYQKE